MGLFRASKSLVTGTGNSDFAAVGSEVSRRCPPHTILRQGGPAKLRRARLSLACSETNTSKRLQKKCITKTFLALQNRLDSRSTRSIRNSRASMKDDRQSPIPYPRRPWAESVAVVAAEVRAAEPMSMSQLLNLRACDQAILIVQRARPSVPRRPRMPVSNERRLLPRPAAGPVLQDGDIDPPARAFKTPSA
jgi:hypothetical protein